MKKRRLNLAWLSGVMFGTLAFLVVCYGIRHFQIKRNCKIFLNLADQAEAKKDAAKLDENLRRYVRLNPKDPNGLVRYVMHQSEPGRWENANSQTKLAIYQKLIQATEYAPERKDVWERLVLLGIANRRYKDTLVPIKNHLLKDAPNNPEFLEYEALCHNKLGNFEDADRCLRKAREEAPQRLSTYLVMVMNAESMIDNKKTPIQNAEPIMNEMVVNNPQDARAYFSRATWRTNQLADLERKRSAGQVVDLDAMQNLKDLIQQDYDHALLLEPNNSSILLRFADYSKRTGMTERARTLLQQGLEDPGADVNFSRELAILEYQTGNPQLGLKILYDAVRAQESLIKTMPKGQTDSLNLSLLDLKFLLAEWGLNRDNDDLVNNDDVAVLIADLKASKKFSTSRISYLEAQYDFTNKNWPEVVSKLGKIRSLLNADKEKLQRLDYLLGVAHSQLQSPEKALQSFQDCLINNKNLVIAYNAQKNLALSLRSLNRLPEAIVELRKIAIKPNVVRTDQILFAEFLLQWNIANPAQQRNWGEFDKILRAIETDEPLFLPAIVLRLQQFNVENRNDEYAQLLRSARVEHPDNLQLFDMEYRLALSQKNWLAAEQMIAAERQARGDSVESRVHEGLLIVSRETQANAKTLLAPLSLPVPEWSSLQQASLAAQFSEFYTQIQAYDKADECLNRAKTAIPSNSGLILKQIQIAMQKVAMQSEPSERVKELLKEYSKLNTENATWNLETARLIYLESFQGERKNRLMDSEAFNDAIRHLKAANQQRTNWDELHYLWGDVLNRHGDLKDSLDEYMAALNAGAKQSIIATKAVDLLMNFFFRYEDADNLLKRLHTSGFSFNNQLLQEEINLALILGRQEQALLLMQALPDETAGTPSGPQFLSSAWRGDKYLALREYKNAEVQYRRALLQNREDPRVIPALLAALMGQGELESARQAFEEALKSIDMKKYPSILAYCYENLGENTLAEKYHRETFESLPQDFDKKFDLIAYLRRRNQFDEAQTELRKIIAELKSRTDNDATTQKYRIRGLLSLADILYTKRQSLPESLDFVNQSLELIGTSESRSSSERETALRLKTRILEKLGNKDDYEQAITILETLAFKPPFTQLKLEDRKLLSKLYTLLGDTTRSRNVLIETVAKIKTDQRYDLFQAELLKELVLQSLNNKEDSVAKDYLSRLKQLAPDALSTKETEVRVLESNNKLDEIQKIINGAVDKYPDEKNIFIWAAELYEFVADRNINNEKTRPLANDFYREAERLYSRYVDLVPENFWLLSAFQLKTEHINEGLDLLNANLDKIQFQHLNVVTRNLMSNHRPEAKSAAKPLCAIFVARIPAMNDTDQTNLQSLMADLLAWSGDDKGAKAIHVKLVAENGNNYVILNNYAFFLALSDDNTIIALQQIDRAILLAGPLADLLDTRGYVQLCSGRSSLAVTSFQAAVNTRESAERYFHLAVAHSKSDPKQPKIAFKAYERAVELGLRESMVIHRREQNYYKQLIKFFKDAALLK